MHGEGQGFGDGVSIDGLVGAERCRIPLEERILVAFGERGKGRTLAVDAVEW